MGAGADPRYNQVTVTEHFAIDLSIEQLRSYSTRDVEIKVYGKRDQGIFTLPASVSSGFLKALDCHFSKAC